MAEGDDNSQKTEEPTAKRQGEAREKGQIAKSREVDHWIMIFAGTMAIAMFAPKMMADLKALLTYYFESAHAVPLGPNELGPVLLQLCWKVAMILAPIFGLLVVAAIGGGVAQHGILIAPDLLKPKFSKINPAAGLKRIFSSRGLVEFFKSALKLAIIGTFAYWLLKGDFNELEKFIFVDLVQTLQLTLALAMKLLVGVLSLLTVIAILDFGYQKFQMLRDMRMSREEIREEYKQAEGDPIVKGRLRQLRMERTRRRMMAAVPKADVVITNPTHYAVALQYEQGTMEAPKLVAKGTDLVAHRIRDLATEHNVPIVENPPVARALYAAVDIDREIPPEHYKAVAEIIGYVMKLRKGQIVPPPPPQPDDYKGEAPPPPAS
jgi:flagellar biosynthesis protein FlhB